MASLELQRAIEEYDDYIAKHGIDLTMYEKYYAEAMKTAFSEGEDDIPYALTVSKKAKNHISNIILKNTDGMGFHWLESQAQKQKILCEEIEKYYEILLLEGRHLLDSYMLYVEKNRPKKERFYEPRRRTLKAVTDKLQALEDDKLDELFIHMPPRCGKSGAITMATSWHCARDTEKSNLYVTYKEGLGGAFIVGVSEIWADPTYCFSDIFPDIKIADSDAKNHKIDLGRKKKYKTLSGKGLESGLNGEYDAYGWLVLDDVLEGIQDVLNPDTLRRKQIIFDNNVMSRAKEQCKIIHNGTIWSLHDLYSDRIDFLQNNPQAKSIRYDIIKIPALDENDESNFDYDYGVGYTTQSFLIKRAKFEENDDIASWLAQYQQEPIERDGAVFNPEHMKFYNGVLPNEEPYRICAACDVALGGEDYLAFVVAYMYEDGSVYIHDVVFDNAEKKYTKPKVAKMFAKHNIGSAYFEANQGGEGYKDEIDEILKNEYGMKVNLVSEYAPSNKRKEQRIWDKAGSIREWYFLDTGYRSPEYRKFMTNVYSFTITGKNKHDDAPDCLASLAYFIEGNWTNATAQAIQNPFRQGGKYYGY